MKGTIVMEGSYMFFVFAFAKILQNSIFSAEESGIFHSGSSF